MQEFLASIPAVFLLLTVAGMVGIESIGLPLPGETVLITATIIAMDNETPVWAIAAAAAVGAIVGDSLGYILGRVAGVRLLEFGRRRAPKVFRTSAIIGAARLMHRYGALAIFFARFVALLRVLSGPLAGTLRYPYLRFFLVNAAGAVVWSGVVTGLVVAAGRAVHDILHGTGGILAGVFAVVIVGIAVVIVRRRRRRRVAAVVEEPIEDDRPLVELLDEVAHERGRKETTR
ncbi:membrane protein DedA with SNARE-associated domain [Microbacterium ginsengiterrae]|uniref:Membrane protein DedA with SNARE-associated domain n=1 Tax=Microbacterium ginsengiterrae TaxID=546115 RepID=A0A7W9CAV3_9MICO|nr:DedA family protein [Microbacterium ginsengiterrae]MBB5742238.1 membrane protein DedA with SNARE-associated domain [Microbacterium ginsengiterrae]